MKIDEETLGANVLLCSECWQECGAHAPESTPLGVSVVVPLTWYSDCHNVVAEPRWALEARGNATNNEPEG